MGFTYEYEQLKTNIKNSKALWKSIKEIAHLNSTKIGSCELLSTRGTPVESVNYANDYFANVGKRLAADIQSKCPQPDSSLIDTPKTQLSSFVLLETDAEEVNVVISNLKTDSAPGWDGIHTKFIKWLNPKLFPLLVI